MKELIATFILALVVSCLLNSLQGSAPPSPWPVGINDVNQIQYGLKRDDMAIGEMDYVNGSRPAKIMSGIDERSDERNSDFPLGAAN